MHRLVCGFLLLGSTLSATAQASRPAAARPAPSTGKAVTSPTLKAFTSCKLPGGPDLVGTTPLPQRPMTRAAQTLSGPKKITIADGLMAAFAFPGAAPFANVKVEVLPTATYASEKADLISEFDKINATGEDTQRNYDLKPTLNGFEIYGFDRTALDGNVLGIYLMFDNPHHIATTAYFLNAPAGQRKFNNVQDYRGLRESFINAYSLCVRKALGEAPAKSAPATQPSHAHKPAHR